MKQYYLILLSLSILFFSCSERHRDIKGEYVFQIEPYEDTLRFSNFFDKYNVVHLKGRIVSNINDVIMLDSVMVIRCNAYESHNDLSGNSAISLFSKDGNFIKPIVRIGRGPDEVLTIEDMCLNRYCGTLDVLCNYGQSIFRYKLDSFSLLDKIEIDKEDIVVANGIAPVSISDYLLYKQYPYSSHQDYKLYLFNRKSSEVKASFIEMDEEMAENLAFSQYNNLFTYDDSVYYYEAFSPAIYKYKDDTVTPWAIFENNRYSIPQKFLKKSGSNLQRLIQNLEESGYVWGHINLFRYGPYLFSTYMCREQSYLSVIDIDNAKSRSYGSIKDDMIWDVETNDVRGVFMLLSSDETGVVYSVEPFVMKELVTSQHGAKTEMREMLMNLPEDANPLLIIMK